LHNTFFYGFIFVVKFPPLGTNKKGVVTYRKDFFFKGKKSPQSCHISKGAKKKKKKLKSPYLPLGSLHIAYIYIYMQGFQKTNSTFLSQL
jgi:hypothetical protein